MSEENVELAHRNFEAFNRRDFDAFLALTDEEVIGAGALASVEGNYHGHAGIRRWWESLLEGMPDATLEVVEVRDVGDLTVSLLRLRAHGAASRTPIEQMLWVVSEWRDRKIVSWRTLRDEAEALKAAGLEQ